MTDYQYKYTIAGTVGASVHNQRVNPVNGRKNKTDYSSYNSFMNKLDAMYEGTSGAVADAYVPVSKRSSLSLKFSNKFLKDYSNGELEKHYRTNFAKSAGPRSRAVIARLHQIFVIENIYDERTLRQALNELIQSGARITRNAVEETMDSIFFTV